MLDVWGFSSAQAVSRFAAMSDVKTKALYSNLAGDPTLGPLVDLFVAEMPSQIARLIDRLEGCDWEGLRQAAHQLKGAAGSYGFPAISPAAAQLEDAIRRQLPEETIRQAVDQLVDFCRQARGGTPPRESGQWSVAAARKATR
jgi:HPt (histidine-containing phosphotransfer) domain-containing protein